MLGPWQPHGPLCWVPCSSKHPQEVLSAQGDGPHPHPSSPSTDHSFPGTSSRRRHLLASQPEFASCSAAGAPPWEQPGTRLEKRKRKDRQKEHGRVNPGESRAGSAARDGGRAARAAETAELEDGGGALSLARQPAGPGRPGWLRGAGTMCLLSPRAATQRLQRRGRLRGRPKCP